MYEVESYVRGHHIVSGYVCYMEEMCEATVVGCVSSKISAACMLHL